MPNDRTDLEQSHSDQPVRDLTGDDDTAAVRNAKTQPRPPITPSTRRRFHSSVVAPTSGQEPNHSSSESSRLSGLLESVSRLRRSSEPRESTPGSSDWWCH